MARVKIGRAVPHAFRHGFPTAVLEAAQEDAGRCSMAASEAGSAQRGLQYFMLSRVFGP